jgi:hypothetical protein
MSNPIQQGSLPTENYARDMMGAKLTVNMHSKKVYGLLSEVEIGLDAYVEMKIEIANIMCPHIL